LTCLVKTQIGAATGIVVTADAMAGIPALAGTAPITRGAAFRGTVVILTKAKVLGVQGSVVQGMVVEEAFPGVGLAIVQSRGGGCCCRNALLRRLAVASASRHGHAGLIRLGETAVELVASFRLTKMVVVVQARVVVDARLERPKPV